MHEESIERRLRGALHEEADPLPFTITAAELERRLALRRRSFAGRRLTLLLAAAVGISLFGVGGALSGLFDQKQPTPTAPVSIFMPTSGPTEAVPVSLPNLDDLVGVDPDSVLVAQAHGPADGPAAATGDVEVAPSSVVLGTFAGGGQYRLGVACLGPSTLVVDVRDPGSRGPDSGPTVGCDGSVYEQTVDSPQPRSVGFRLTGQASWRAVVRGPALAAEPGEGDAIPPAPATEQELVRVDALAIDPAAEAWGSAGLLAQEIGAIAPRESYSITSLCTGPSPIRIVFGDQVDGRLVADTETELACTLRSLQGTYLGIAQPNGSRVFVAGRPHQQVSVLVSSAMPPVALTTDLPGWQLSGGLGPEYAFETHGMSFGGAGVGEDHIEVVMACTGTEPIEVAVEDAITQTFSATCAPDGATTSRTFKVTESGVRVRFVAPKGTWTALSILVPSN
jgi:hypothetical protein